MRNTVLSLAKSAACTLAVIVAIAGCGRSVEPESAATEAVQPSSEARGLELLPLSYPDDLFESLVGTLAAYEEIRSLLAQDRVEGVAAAASQLVAGLEAAGSRGAELPDRLAALLEEALRAARSLGSARSLESVRAAFGEVSRLLIPLAAVDARLSRDRYVFSCPMVKDRFNKWMQPFPELENPFMGQAMPGCGEAADWSVTAPLTSAEAEAHVEHAHEGGVSHYTCSMHPSVRRQEPGTCPICSMDLVPVTREEVETGVFTVDAQRRQLIGVRTAAVGRRPVEIRVRAVGRIVYDETRLSDVSVKFRGWIGRLSANSMGQEVRKGETLFTLYSPELYSAQEEYLVALASQRAAAGTSAPARADYLVNAARERLRLWDLRDWLIDQIAEKGSPLEHIPVVSPVSGVVIEKNVVEGAAVEPGMKLFRIAALETVWVEAEVYESELPLVSVGQEAEVVLPYFPDKRFRGDVSFVYPYLDSQTRTGRVRIELANATLELRPDMYADVELAIDHGERLVVPAEAVLHAGPRRLVFLDLGEGRLKPQEIEIGVKSGDDYEVLAGLEEGDIVVASGNFLIAAESRLKSAVEQW
jgi:Cu(I)/Ag(I) efflux system membrane fusion protein